MNKQQDNKLNKVKKERVDKTKNKIKVIKELLKNPLQTEREVAKKAHISKGSAHNHKKELGQIGPKIDAIQEIIKNDIEIVKNAQAEINRRISKEPEKVSTRDLISAGDTSAKRYTIFKGDATDDEGGAKDIIITRGL